MNQETSSGRPRRFQSGRGKQRCRTPVHTNKGRVWLRRKLPFLLENLKVSRYRLLGMLAGIEALIFRLGRDRTECSRPTSLMMIKVTAML